MSWLPRSLADSLGFDGDAAAGRGQVSGKVAPCTQSPNRDSVEDQERGSGVTQDLSELKQTLTRQLWGVATFLAPPPPHSNRSDPPSSSLTVAIDGVSDDDGGGASDGARIEGMRRDISEIGGRLRSGFSNLSNNKAVSEISKIASNFLPFGPEDEDPVSVEGNESEYDFGGVVGITEEVLNFAGNISMHPETWLDFPLEEEQDIDGFDLSDAQEKHALAVEHLLPRLEALRIEFCPNHMTKSYFWKVYFLLLHSRLNKHDAELLSTPQIVAARARWMRELEKQRAEKEDCWPRGVTSYSKEECYTLDEDITCSPLYGPPFEIVQSRKFAFDTTDIEIEKYALESTEMEIIDKSIIEETPVIASKYKDIKLGLPSKVISENYEDDGDDWPQEEISEYGAYSGVDTRFGSEEDVSFSDLEEDCSVPVKL